MRCKAGNVVFPFALFLTLMTIFVVVSDASVAGSWVSDSSLLGRVKGVDISHYQHNCKLCKDYGSGYICPTDCQPIKWDNVSKYYKFVYIQASQGDTSVPRLKNPMIEKDVEDAKNKGLLVGVYHLPYPSKSTAESEAQHFVNVAKNYLKPGYLQPMLDIEQDECNKFTDKAVLVKWIKDWINAVRQKTGNDNIKPILYTGCYCADALKKKDPTFINELLNEGRLWIARYTDTAEHTPSDNPPASYLDNPCVGLKYCNFNASKWGFWQWTCKMKVDGIPSKYVDEDIFNGNISELQTHIIKGASPRIITVGHTPGADYWFIQDAINASKDGDIIEVWYGTYSEHIVINKSITLRSRDGVNMTFIDGLGSGTVVNISANNVKISGFTIENGDIGIKIEANNTIIRGNTI